MNIYNSYLKNDFLNKMFFVLLNSFTNFFGQYVFSYQNVEHCCDLGLHMKTY
jgi:hypothetical protein